MKLRRPLLFDGPSAKLPFCFGALYLAALLIIAAYHVFVLNLLSEFSQFGLRVNQLSVLGQFLPERVLESTALFLCAKLVFILAALFWLLHLALPLSPWLAVLSFTLVVSMHVETLHYTNHMFHAVNNVLFILAVWYQTGHADLRRAFRQRQWKALLVPMWIVELSVWWAAVTYGHSGWLKLLMAGPAWASGTAFQLWAYEWAPPGFFQSLIVENRALALVLQAGVLAAEVTCFFCLWFEKIRPLYGLVFAGFHLGSVLLFGTRYDFYGNIAVALFVFVLAPVVTYANRHSDLTRARSIPS